MAMLYDDKYAIEQLLEKLLVSRNDDQSNSCSNYIIPTSPSATSPGYVTFQCLVQELSELLQLANGGRLLSLVDASQLLSVDIRHIEAAAQELCTSTFCNNSVVVELLVVQNNELLLTTTEYLSTSLVQDAELLVHMNGGKMLTSDVACHLRIPTNKLVQILLGLELRPTTITSDNTLKLVKNNRVIITTTFAQCQEHKLKGAFLAITIPTYIDDYFISNSLNNTLDLEDTFTLVKEMCESSILPGELRMSSSSSVSQVRTAANTKEQLRRGGRRETPVIGSAISEILYIPKVHLTLQRQTVDRLFKTNGYITKAELDNLAVSKGKMVDFVKNRFPNAIALPNSIIDPNVIITLVESAASDADQLRSFVDMRSTSCLPEYIVSNQEDMEEILKTCNTDLGSSIVYHGTNAFYFSSGIIHDILKNIIPPLAQEFGKARATELFLQQQQEEDTTKINNNYSTTTFEKQQQAKLLRDRKHFARIAVAYPELVSPDSINNGGDYHQDLKKASDPSTNDKVEVSNYWDEDEVRSSISIISEFCRKCLLRESLVLCEESVTKHLEKIKHCNSNSKKQRGTANKVIMFDVLQSLEATFEKCFTPLCYNVQMFSKLSKALDDVKPLRATLERNFLTSVGADYAKRLTEYCLHKYITDYTNNDTKFYFTADGNSAAVVEEPQDSIPSFCRLPDPSVRRFPNVIISCTRKDSDEAINPLEALREELPSSVGVNLARLWTYLGGQCYDGGEVIVKDEVYVRSGNLEKFLSHIEEHCLQICGLPFKIFDKKSEKNSLLLRRRALSGLLENDEAIHHSSDAEILELTVILLLQKTKNLAAVGISDVCLLTQVLLSLAEHSLPPIVVETLVDAKTRVQDNESFDEALRRRIRRMGLCQNIGKYDDEAC